jgi:hypothetical protein
MSGDTELSALATWALPNRGEKAEPANRVTAASFKGNEERDGRGREALNRLTSAPSAAIWADLAGSGGMGKRALQFHFQIAICRPISTTASRGNRRISLTWAALRTMAA